MKNALSDIYTNKILLNEEKHDVVKGSKELDSKIGKAHLAKGTGTVNADKDLETPKKVEENMNTEENTTKKTFEGAFERLFKSAINEDVAEDAAFNVEVPTTPEDAVEELEGEADEVSDLVSDIRSVIDHLQSILDKVSGEESHSEEESEDELADVPEEGESSEEEPFEEAVELKPLPHTAGLSLTSKGKADVKGVHTSKGKAHGGDVDADPKLKPFADKSAVNQGPKKKAEVGSVKVGDFFK